MIDEVNGGRVDDAENPMDVRQNKRKRDEGKVVGALNIFRSCLPACEPFEVKNDFSVYILID